MMYRPFARLILLAPLLLTACAHPLEDLVEQHHQQRIDAAIANQPITHGATDGMGSYIAESAPHMTLQTTDATSQKNP